MADGVPGTPQAHASRAPVCLLLLCGLPAAGKTTLATALQAAARDAGGNGPDVLHVCFDAHHQQAEGDRFDPEAWKAGRHRALAQLSAALAARRSAVAPLLVVADDNMHLRSMRRQARLLAAEHSAAFQILYLRCPPGTAMRLNAARAPLARVPPDAIRRMCQVFEEPSAADAPAALHMADAEALQQSDLQQAAARLLTAVLAAWGPPQRLPSTSGMDEQREAGRAATTASAAHQLDISSRAVLAAAITACANASPQLKAQLAQNLNAQRRSMLDGFRRDAADSDAGTLATQWLRTFEAAADEAVVLIGIAHLGVT